MLPRYAHIWLCMGLVFLGCRSNRQLETKESIAPSGIAEPQQLIPMAQVFQGITEPHLKSLDEIKNGPLPPAAKIGRDAFHWGQEVSCIFSDQNFETAPADEASEFLCDIVDKNQNILVPSARIHYGADNAALYSQLAASRLVWLLGFPVDHSYAIKVRCLGCPSLSDPATLVKKFHGSSPSEKSALREATQELIAKKAARYIDPALVVFPWAETLTIERDEGTAWSLYEELAKGGPFSKLSEQESEDEVMRRQALLLLASLLGLVEQTKHEAEITCQRLLEQASCAPQSAWLQLKDLGRSLGAPLRPGLSASASGDPKQDLQRWANPQLSPLFTAKDSCEITLKGLALDGRPSPDKKIKISDAARYFLISRFVALGGSVGTEFKPEHKAVLRVQLEKVFIAGRQAELFRNNKWWVDAVMMKVDELLAHQGCRSV